MSNSDRRPNTTAVRAGESQVMAALPPTLAKQTRSFGGKFAGIWRDRSITFQYTVYGALFGFAFPVFSTLLDLLLQQLPLTWQNLLYVQSRTPLHWVIDTAPFFLGLFASFAGMRQERLEQRSQERNQALHQLESLQTGLEQLIADRTRALVLATDVGQRLLTVRNLDTLLGEAVELIRSRFDLYYAQVYLMDSTGRNLILRAGTGQAGALLVRRGHTLPVGPGSINGTAAAEKRAVIVSHTAQSSTYRINPLLPETRSEVAVPMMVGGQVVGVLNLQDDQSGSLTHESLPVFETLASQFTVAVDNASLFADAVQARADLEVEFKRVAGSGWQDFLDAIHRGERIGYTLAGGVVEPLTESLTTKAASHVLQAPIQVQEASVGSIQVEGEAGRSWTEVETELVTSVARTLAQHVENLRLLAQADQYRAVAEQSSRRLTREGWLAYLAAKAALSTGFVYDRYEVKPLAGESAETVEAREPALTRPLQVRGEAIGELALGQVKALDDEAIELVDTVAARLSAHIETLRLFEEIRTREHELEERRQELEASQRVTFTAAETTDPDVLLDLVVDLIRDQFDLYHVQVYLTDKVQNAAVLRKSTGYAGQQLLARGHQIPLDRPSLVTRAINEGQSVIVNDVTTDENWLPNPLLPHTQSELVLPLRTKDGVIGALDVQARTPNRFTPTLTVLFQAMAEQVAMNFQTTDLLIRTTEQAESLTRFTTQLRTAAEVTRRMGTVLDPERLLEQTVELLQSHFGLYHAHIYVVDEINHRLVMRAGSGEVGRVLRQRGHAIPLDATRSLVSRAAHDEQTILVDDTSLDPDFMPNPLLPQTRTELSIPLIVGKKVLGVLDIQDDQPNRFSEADIDTFSTLGRQIAITLQTADMFEQTRLRLQLSQALADTQTEEQVLDVLTEQSGVYPQVCMDIMTLERDGDDDLTLVSRRSSSFDSGIPETPTGTQFPASQFLLLSLITPDTLFVSPDVFRDEHVDEDTRALASQEGWTSIAIVPITTGGNWLGVVIATSKQEGCFDASRLALYQTLAEQGAIALQIARLNDENMRTAERLKEMDRLKSEFLANMSHELRTPLNSIIGYVQLLLMDLEGEIPEESYEDMKSVETNSKHLLNLINDVLDLARIEAGRMELHMENMDVPSLIDIVKSNNAGLFVDSALAFTMKAELDLPQISADPIRITQVLNNLISNAYKFTDAGGITVRAYREDGEVCIAVEDTGIGIAEEDIDTIFERFRQVDGSFTRRAEGTGLGLSITHRLVEMHGGRLSVHSKLGEGSTFTIYLPAAA